MGSAEGVDHWQLLDGVETGIAEVDDHVCVDMLSSDLIDTAGTVSGVRKDPESAGVPWVSLVEQLLGDPDDETGVHDEGVWELQRHFGELWVRQQILSQLIETVVLAQPAVELLGCVSAKI